jgi:hypothetical protein
MSLNGTILFLQSGFLLNYLLSSDIIRYWIYLSKVDSKEIARNRRRDACNIPTRSLLCTEKSVARLVAQLVTI